MTLSIRFDTRPENVQPQRGNYVHNYEKFVFNQYENLNAHICGMPVQITSDAPGQIVDGLYVSREHHVISCVRDGKEYAFEYTDGQIVVLTIGEVITIDVEQPA